MAPSRMAGGLSQSSASSGIFFQGDAQSQNVINSHLSSSFGNSANSLSGTGCSNLGLVSSNVNQSVLNSVANSGPSVGASSLVTDANSAFSGGGSHLQRSASINNESYLRYPGSPMSFSSNNISVSGSSVIDGPTAMHQGSHHDPSPNSQQAIQSQQQSPQGGASQTGQLTMSMGSRFPASLSQDPTSISQLHKKPRLDIKQEDILQQQVLHQMLQRQDSMQLQSQNPHLQAILQQQRLRQQQQQQHMLQVMSPMQRIQFQQQQQQQQLRQLQQVASIKNPYDTGGVCARRLMQYLYHQRQRPQENTFAYWRKLVAEYYAPRAKKRWCLSQYDNVGHHALGVFPQASMDAWQCEICGIKSGRGFEATYEVLPRLNEIKFGSGVIDELLFVDLPRERRFVNGVMMLEYGKAVQESVYEQLRVVREGQLRIIFTQDLKILSWDFCARRHEELLPRRLVGHQVNQLLQVAQKCQSTLVDGGLEGVSSQDLQTNSNMVVTAGRQLAKSLDLQSLNDLGFSKRYVRCLQIAEVVNSMKDLIDYCRDSKIGPIEGLKTYPQSSAPNIQMQRMQEMERLASIQGLPTDRNTLNKLMAMQQPGMNNSSTGNNPNVLANNRGALSLSNYQNIMIRQNSMNFNNNSYQQEASTHINPNQTPSCSFQGPSSSVLPQNLQGNEFSNTQMGASQMQHTNDITHQNQHTDGGPTLNKSNSFKAGSNSDSLAAGGGGLSNSGFNQQTQELASNLHLTDDIPDLSHDFTDSGFFGSDLDDNMSYDGWKA